MRNWIMQITVMESDGSSQKDMDFLNLIQLSKVKLSDNVVCNGCNSM